MELAPRQRWCLQMMHDISSDIRRFPEGSVKPRRRHSRHISQLQLIWRPATICHMGKITTSRSWVEWYSYNCVESDHMLNSAGSWIWIWTRRSHAIWTDPWVGIFLWWTICHRIMGRRWRVNQRWTLWRFVNMTFRGLTELQEQSRNAAHTSAIKHRVETNGWNQLDHSRKWIPAGYGLRPERHCGQRWLTRDGSRAEMVRGSIGSRLDMDG